MAIFNGKIGLLRQILRPRGLDIIHVPLMQQSEWERPCLRKPDEPPYAEKDEAGPLNLDVKTERIKSGGPFEWPHMISLNHALAKFIDDQQRIVEIGSGTGCFAEAASGRSKSLVCAELDKKAHEWSKINRQKENIKYINYLPTEKDGPFDIAISVDVIEHVGDFRNFISMITKLAPRAIITTPNKNRYPETAIAAPPVNLLHVREWTAGEFYWILRCYYDKVNLYAKGKNNDDEIVPVTLGSTLHTLVADCREPKI